MELYVLHIAIVMIYYYYYYYSEVLRGFLRPLFEYQDITSNLSHNCLHILSKLSSNFPVTEHYRSRWFLQAQHTVIMYYVLRYLSYCDIALFPAILIRLSWLIQVVDFAKHFTVSDINTDISTRQFIWSEIWSEKWLTLHEDCLSLKATDIGAGYADGPGME
jgi:hypothetical protein